MKIIPFCKCTTWIVYLTNKQFIHPNVLNSQGWMKIKITLYLDTDTEEVSMIHLPEEKKQREDREIERMFVFHFSV